MECERGNRCTVRVDNYFEILEEKAKQEAERKEQERINCWFRDGLRFIVRTRGQCARRTQCGQASTHFKRNDFAQDIHTESFLIINCVYSIVKTNICKVTKSLGFLRKNTFFNIYNVRITLR